MDSDEFLDDSFEESLREIETSELAYSTPPSTATKQLQQDIPLFVCIREDEEPRSCSNEGPVGKGLLRSLIHKSDPLPDQFTDPIASLFGHKAVVYQAFSRDLGRSFLSFRYQLNTLFDCADPGQAGATISHSITFLSILECFVHRQLVNHTPHQQQQPHPLVVRFATDLVAHLLHVWDQVDPPPDTLTRLHHCAPGKDLLHLTLHLHWTTVSVLYRLSELLGWSAFLEHVHSLCKSLLFSAATRYNQWVQSDVPITKKTFYSCSCILEVWLLVRYTTDTLALSGNTESFWSIVTRILSDIISGHAVTYMEDQTAVVKVQDPVGFAWWALVSLCPLYSYSEEGKVDPIALQNRLKPCWTFLQDLLPLTFHQDVTEQQLRTYMSSHLFLVHHWPTTSDPIVQAWDHFHKHMNDSFHVVGRGIQEWVAPELHTPRQWVHYIKGLCTAEGRGLQGVTTSYDHFLCSLAATLNRSHDPLQMWKQLKGRFYSKIHGKWLQGLGLTGVRHFLSLLLVLAWSGDTAEISQKSVTYICTLGLCVPKDKTTVLVWKGMLALLVVCEEKNVSFCSMIEKISPSVSLLAQGFLSGAEDKQLCWEVICLLLDGSLELLQGLGGVALSSGPLLGGCLGNLIASLQGHELIRVLQCVEGVAMELCSHHHTLQRQPVGNVELQQQADSIRGYCRLFLQSCVAPLLAKAKLPLPPPQLATSVAVVTSLACDCSGSLTPLGVNNTSLAEALFEEYALKDTTVASLACSYICHLGGTEVTRRVLLQYEGAQWKVAHTWFRGVLQMHSTPSCVNTVQELSEILVELPVISELLKSSDCHSHDTLSVLCALVSSINIKYLAADLQEAALWRDKMATLLGDLLSYMEPALSGSAPGDSLKLCYSVAAYLVELCPKVIYGRAQTARWCVLPQLVDRLFFPVQGSSKPLVQGVSICTHLHLHQFLAGLLQLDPQEDGFVKRKVQRLFSQYFLACIQPKQTPAASLSSNPFMLLLRPCMDQQEPSQEACERLLHVFTIVSTGFLVLPQQPISLLPTIKFLRQVIERVRCVSLLIRCLPVLLGSLLSCHLACEVCSRQSEPHGIRRLVMDILRTLLAAHKQHPDILPPDSLRLLLRDFIATNVKQFGGAVFMTLQSLSDLQPNLVAGVLQDACQLVEKHEVRPGIGGGLRAAYEALELHVKTTKASGDM